MTTPHKMIEFAGIDAARGGDTIPRWYVEALGYQYSPDNRQWPTFRDVIRDLPTAKKATIGYYDPKAGEYREDSRHVALINPDWLGDGLDSAPQDSAIWHIPTDSYSIVNPIDGLRPLEKILRTRVADDNDDGPGDVFGQIRLYRNGGEVHGDIVFNGYRIAEPGMPTTPFRLGLSFGYDFFGGHALYAKVLAYHTKSGIPMRDLTESRNRRHVGDAAETVAEWWDDVLDAMQAASETIMQVISDARSYYIAFEDLPLDLQEYYEALGFPEYLAESAALQPLVQPIHSEPNAWKLYRAMALTLDEDFDGKDGASTLQNYIAKTNDILYVPPKTEKIAIEAKQQEIRAQDTMDAADENDLQRLDDAIDNDQLAGDPIEQFTKTRDRLRTLLADAKDSNQ